VVCQPAAVMPNLHHAHSNNTSNTALHSTHQPLQEGAQGEPKCCLGKRGEVRICSYAFLFAHPAIKEHGAHPPKRCPFIT
jgi:hypothetical protein